MLTTQSVGLLAALLILAAFLAGCGGSGLPESSARPVSETGTGGSGGGPPGPPDFNAPGAEPGPEFDPIVIPDDIVYDDSEPSGFITCTESNAETGEVFTANCANDELMVYFTDDATVAEIEAAFTAIGAHKKRYSPWCSMWLIGLDEPAASCAELQAKVDVLSAQPKVSSVWKNWRCQMDD